MPVTRVLITVKTYPTISGKYDELVCTAGLREDGSWVRVYPIPFRQRPYHEQYRKYQWIELDLVKNTSDFRPESYRPRSFDTPINIVGEIKADGDTWNERRDIVLRNIHYDLSQLIVEAKDRNIGTSLCVFKPARILDFEWQEVNREWSKEKIENLRQMSLFDTVDTNRRDVVRKLPYNFYYIFEDRNGKRSRLMIEDWETGQLFWNCLERHKGDEEKACEDVKKKYFDDFALTKDLYFFLGTTLQFHLRAPNPFIIIGTFHPKLITQMKLF